MDSLWTEKYRPDSLEGVIGQPQATEKLRPLLTEKGFPHLLLVGPSGTGKTTCSLILAKHVLGGRTEGNFLRLDAVDLTKNRSDEGSIRKESSPLWRIREFAVNASIDGVSFRVVMINDADTLSKEIQEALRRTMEIYAANCSFILTCTHSSGIIGPVRSRCTEVRFNPIPRKEMADRIAEIISLEKPNAEEGIAYCVATAACGNIRKAMLILQSCAVGGERITADAVYAIADSPASDITERMMRTALKGDVRGARDLLDSLIADRGMSGKEIIREIHRKTLFLGLSDSGTFRLMDRIGETDYRIAQCGTGPMAVSLQRVQLENFLAYLAMTGKSG